MRRVRQGDVQEIARIAAAGWWNAYRDLISPEEIDNALQQAYSVETLRRRLTGPPLHVAENAGKVVGYVQHGPVGEFIHEVYAIYVDPAMLGEGIGWALWQQVARDARSGGRSAIELWVLEGNQLGINWYKRQGGHPVGRREIELPDGGHTELRYRFDLNTG